MVVATAMKYLEPDYRYVFQLRKGWLGDYCCLWVGVEWFFRATLLLIKKHQGRVRYVWRISHKVLILLAVGAHIFCGSYINGQLDVVMFVKCL